MNRTSGASQLVWRLLSRLWLWTCGTCVNARIRGLQCFNIFESRTLLYKAISLLQFLYNKDNIFRNICFWTFLPVKNLENKYLHIANNVSRRRDKECRTTYTKYFTPNAIKIIEITS